MKLKTFNDMKGAKPEGLRQEAIKWVVHCAMERDKIIKEDEELEKKSQSMIRSTEISMDFWHGKVVALSKFFDIKDKDLKPCPIK